MIISQTPYKVNTAGTYLHELFPGDVYVAFDGSWLILEPGKGTQYVTTCVIRTVNPVLVASGLAVHNPKDACSRETGKNVAYRRAVDAFLDELERSQVAVTINRKAARKILWDGLHAVMPLAEGVR